jgi:hypothetical protein
MGEQSARCAVCGAHIVGRRLDAVYCGAACQQKAHRARTARRIAALIARVESNEQLKPTTAGIARSGERLVGPVDQAHTLRGQARLQSGGSAG